MASQTYPHAPGFRASAPETSAEAARSAKENAATIRARVLEELKRRSLTANEAAARLRQPWMNEADMVRFERSVQSRISELSAAGKVLDTGMRRLNSSGRNAVVWAAGGDRYKQPNLI